MIKVYIAGAITDNPNYRAQFAAAEERLKSQGFAVINPCKNDGFTYREYINMGLCELMHCDAIYLLKGYENSTGAALEHDYARTVGLRIMREEDEQIAAVWKFDGILDTKALKAATESLAKVEKMLKTQEFTKYGEVLRGAKAAAEERAKPDIKSLMQYLDNTIALEGTARITPERAKLLLDMLKKAQPRAVITDYGFTLCPYCGSDVDECDEYCRQCGQHLD